MKKTQKTILGFSGLALVAAMTAIAATLPAPGASAVSSLTDTLTVRVVGDTPTLDVTTSEPDIVTEPLYTYNMDFTNVDTITATLYYTSPDGTTTESKVIGTWNPDYEPGNISSTINLKTDAYGYGDYRIEVVGVGFDGVETDPEILKFSYVAGEAEDDGKGNVIIKVDTNDGEGTKADVVITDKDGNVVKEFDDVPVSDDGSIKINVSDLPEGDYNIHVTVKDDNGDTVSETNIDHKSEGAPEADVDDSGDINIDIDTDEGNVDKVTVVIKDKDGNVVKEFDVEVPEDGKVKIPMPDDLPGGDYTVEITAKDGSTVVDKYVVIYTSSNPPHAGSPDTGGLFKNLNISKVDYLVTGLIIFFVFAVVGAGIIIRGRSKNMAMRGSGVASRSKTSTKKSAAKVKKSLKKSVKSSAKTTKRK